MNNLTRVTNQLFEDVFQDFFGPTYMVRPESTYPLTNIEENKDSWNIQVAAPGMKKSDFKLSLDTTTFSVSYERTEKTNNFVKSSFKKTWNVPNGIQAKHIKAKYDAGILSVELKKPSIFKDKASLIKVD